MQQMAIGALDVPGKSSLCICILKLSKLPKSKMISRIQITNNIVVLYTPRLSSSISRLPEEAYLLDASRSNYGEKRLPPVAER